MRIRVRDTAISIDDIYTEYSPLLHTMRNSPIGVDSDDTGAVLLDVDPEIFHEYVSFLQGNDFKMNEEIAELFDFMGHTNTMEYPLDYWRIKLRDNWIRDNMYKLSLYDDPFYGLKEIPIVERLPVDIPHGWYVAGGAAMWMAGMIEKHSDIDLFTCMSQDDACKSMMFLNDRHSINDIVIPLYRVSVSGNSVSTYKRDGDEGWEKYNMQFILRLYKAPTEIVHGFDLDCVGIIYDPSTEKLYATQRTICALTNMVNWLDPARASPSYVGRLLKYVKRNIRLKLPLISEDKLNHEKINKYREHIKYISRTQPVSVEDILDTVAEVIDPFTNEYGNRITPEYVSREHIIESISDALRDRLLPKVPVGQMLAYNYKHIDVIEDPASLLILAAFFDIYVLPRNMKVYDYETHPHTSHWENHPYNDSYMRHIKTLPFNDEHGNFVLDTSKLKWKSQNPMEQVSSTCIPTPIDDLQEWYKSSPLML